MANTRSFDRLLEARDLGLLSGGNDAAVAYLASEKEKAAESSRSYEDFVRRVSDVVALEDIPVARAQNLASVLSASNAAARPGSISGGFGLSGRPKNTELGPIIQSMRDVMPKQAPAPYNINPAALEPVGGTDGTIKIPARKPEDILSEIGLTPTAMPGTVPEFPTGAPSNPNAPPTGAASTYGRLPDMGSMNAVIEALKTRKPIGSYRR